MSKSVARRPSPNGLTRRGLVSAGGALAVGAFVAACGDGGDTASTGGGAWTFTDDRGAKDGTRARPRRIVGYVATATALYDFGYFEELSWENAGKYKADVITLDSRTRALQPKGLGAKPAWRELPAVRAGQVIPWQPEPRFSYAGCAPILEALAASVRSAKKTG